jgi:hypothetical protein
MAPVTYREYRTEGDAGRINDVRRIRRRGAPVSVTAKTFSPTSLLCRDLHQYIDAGFS